MVKHILFVCTGNTCRSPLAEGILRSLAKREGLELSVRSAGVAAMEGMPISKHSSDILRDKKGEAGPASKALTPELADWADLILTMTISHKRLVIQRFPQTLDKVHALKEYTENDPSVLDSIAEKEALISELQLKQVLGQPVTEEERERLWRLERRAPDYDVADPFGGTRSDYDLAAAEIEECLVKLISRWRQR